MDKTGLLVSYGYVFSVLFLGEGIRKSFRLPTEFTRKFVHIGVGNWYLLALYFFSKRTYALIPPLSFVIMNYISYRLNVFKAIELKDENNLGTVYFPISLCILIWLFWNKSAYLGGIGIMAMTWGDGFAAIVGRRWGKRLYSIFGNSKSIEGSLAMFGFSLLSITLFLVNFASFGIIEAITRAVFLALVATGVEACSKSGLDNILVPLITSFAALII